MVRTTGSVVALMGRGCPLVEFFPRPGERITFTGEVCSRPGYAEGDTVELFYDPLEPQHAHIDSFLQNWFISLILGAIGLFFTLIGLVLLIPEALVDSRRKRLKLKARPYRHSSWKSGATRFPPSTMCRPGNWSVSGATRVPAKYICSTAKTCGSTRSRLSGMNFCR